MNSFQAESLKCDVSVVHDDVRWGPCDRVAIISRILKTIYLPNAWQAGLTSLGMARAQIGEHASRDPDGLKDQFLAT